nr:ATP-binding protein [uncultured Roseateles sp.]
MTVSSLQRLANLVRENGEVLLRTWRTQVRGLAEDQGIVECWVSDNGQGIAVDMIEKVFDKGESGSEAGAGSGLGLGLAIVKSFIEAHDGSITLQSVLGQGSKFYFTLPTQTKLLA